MRRHFEPVARRPGATATAALELLERRLDNVIFRLGLAPTIRSTRQLVVHGHVRVNGRRVTRPGFGVRVGDVVAIAPRGHAIPLVADILARGPEVRLPDYLERSPEDAFSGRVVGRPMRDDVPLDVDETAIVEFYAR